MAEKRGEGGRVWEMGWVFEERMFCVMFGRICALDIEV